MPSLRTSGASRVELRPAPLEPLEGLLQDPLPQFCRSAAAELAGQTRSQLLIGAADPNLSPPGKPRSWAWLRARM